MKPFKFTSWSWSRYYDYTLCPLKAKLAHLDKIREPKNAAMIRGADLHDHVRDYLRGKVKKLLVELKAALKFIDPIKKLMRKRILGPIVEEDWAFTKDWNQTQWNDWDHCVLRVKIDAAHYLEDDVLQVTDWKTGKFRAELVEEYLEQLSLYALAALVILPHVQEVRPRLVFLDLGIEHPPVNKPIRYFRADLKKLKAKWEKQTRAMLNDTTFAPRPNDKCKWCWYGQSGKRNGGPGLCKF